jgi:hypothetical protein
MAIINYTDITKGIESILNRRLSGYIVTRNERKNSDPNKCIAAGTGWIGIYKGSVNYDAYVMGSRPWKITAQPYINLQVVSTLSGEDAENRLQAAEKEVIQAIETDRTLGGSVAMILGYNMEYEYNDDNEIYFIGVNIKINCETRG